MSGIGAVQEDLSKRKYTPFSEDLNKETENEKETIENLRKIFEAVIRGDNAKNKHTYPTTHARTLGVVKGKLIIPQDLPPHLKQGPFKAGTYPVLMRHSENFHDVSGKSLERKSRGLAVKIFNVQGERFEEGAGNTTQDMLLQSQIPVSELNTAKVAFEIIALLAKALQDPEGSRKAMLARPDILLQSGPTRQKRRQLQSMEYYGQYSYRFGNFVAKYAIFPTSEAQLKLSAAMEDPHGDIDELKQLLKDYYAANEATYDLRFQLLENISEQPVEDAGVEWPKDKYPYQTVGKFVFPKQDSANEELFNFWVDSIPINIWRGLKAMQPLGSACRARRVMYPWSKKLRCELNPSKLVDVQKIEDVPGSTIFHPGFFQTLFQEAQGLVTGNHDSHNHGFLGGWK